MQTFRSRIKIDLVSLGLGIVFGEVLFMFIDISLIGVSPYLMDLWSAGTISWGILIPVWGLYWGTGTFILSVISFVLFRKLIEKLLSCRRF